MLADLLNVAVMGFAVSSMALVGLTYTLSEVLGPLRSVRLIVLGLAANFVLVPAWAVLVTNLLAVDDPYQIGILLVASAAGAPFLVKLVVAADGDLAYAASLLVLLLPATVLYMPLVVPWIAPDADVDAGAIAMPLVLTNLVPIAAGMVVLGLWPAVAKALRPVLGPLSTVLLVALLVLTVSANGEELLDVVGQRAIIAAFLVIVGAFVIGFVLGAPDEHKDEIGLATAQRNIAAATVVATQAIGDARTVVTVVVASTVSMAILFPLTVPLRKHFGQTARAAARAKARRAPGGTTHVTH